MSHPHELADIQADAPSGAASRDEAATRIVEVVRSFGLQPVDPPPALTSITSDDVGVVCWMGVLPPA